MHGWRFLTTHTAIHSQARAACPYIIYLFSFSSILSFPFLPFQSFPFPSVPLWDRYHPRCPQTFHSTINSSREWACFHGAESAWLFFQKNLKHPRATRHSFLTTVLWFAVARLCVTVPFFRIKNRERGEGENCLQTCSHVFSYKKQELNYIWQHTLLP